MKDIKVKLISYDYHRNGCCGAPFHVAIFDAMEGDDTTRMVGVVFDQDAHVAVFDLAKLAAGDIAFGSNSYRGDWYEKPLREAIKAAEDQEEKQK